MKHVPYRLPWPLALAILTAFAALGLRQGSPGMLPLLGVALLATYAAPFRIPQKSWAPWVLRIVAYGWISTTIGRDDESTPLLFSGSTIDAFGMIWAIETVVQAWRERPAGKPAGASLIVLSALAFVSASTTMDDDSVRWTAPVYLLFLALSLRSLEHKDAAAQAVQAPHDDTAARSAAIRAAAGRFAALASFLLVGFGVYEAMYQNRDQLMTVGSNWTPHGHPPEATGLSTAPALGDTFGLDGSPTRVLRIVGRLTDPHLRGLTFDQYHHGTWLPVLESRHFTDVTYADLHGGIRGERTRVHCYADGLHILVAPLDTAGVAPLDDISINRLSDQGGSLQTDAQAPYAYDLVLPRDQPGLPTVLAPGSKAGEPPVPVPGGNVAGPFDAAPSAADLSRCLQIPPEIEPGVHAMAHRIESEALAKLPGERELTPEQKIDAVTAYLMSHYAYSLTFHPTPGDKVSAFLLRGHAAHCEYFASAATILLRLLGVPTRYATGYYAHEGSPDGSIMVRQRDSHAWAESWIDGRGWVTVDATPGGGRPDKLYPGAPPAWKIWEWVADRVQDARDYLSRFTPGQLSTGFGLIALLIFALRFAWTRLRLRRVTALPVEMVDAEMREMSARFERLLSKAGADVPASRTWREFVSAALPPALDRDGVERFVSLYNALRFGRSDDDRLRAETREALLALEKGSEKNGNRHEAVPHGDAQR